MSGSRDLARKMFSGGCEFVAGAAVLESLPASCLPEVAFVGRSNVGKSSLINAIVGRAGLARVSQTPGRTRQVNLFCLAHRLMLADLPGYGFARVPKSESAAWNGLIRDYLESRKNLRRVVLLADARRGIMKYDEAVMGLLDAAAVPYQLILTKAQMLDAAEVTATMRAVAEGIARHPAALAAIIATDAKSGMGVEELREYLAQLAAH